MKKIVALAFSVIVCLVSCTKAPHTLHIVTTGDVHGSWFDQPYVEGGKVENSLLAVNRYVDSLRNAVGRKNVILLDAGDCLQGDNAVYYYNYVATGEKHLFPKIVKYMGYDAVVAGNHDIEAGHPVYDKVAAELKAAGIPFLGGNIIRDSDGKPYFPVYTVLKRGGLKVLVLGFENPNISNWLSEPLWKGLSFLSLVPYVQECVDSLTAEIKPDAVVVVAHSGTGDGDGSVLESQGLDVFNNITGIDLLVTSHDHQTMLIQRDNMALVNCGSRASHVTHTIITSERKGRRLLSKKVEAEIVPMDRNKVDENMREAFKEEFEAVRKFTVEPVGNIVPTLRTREAYVGMCDYVNLVHTVQISVPEARLSFAAPLTFDGTVESGEVIFDDMFTIYPYENAMKVINLSGEEIKNYLEYSYDAWIQTPGEHVLKISPREGRKNWSFDNRSYNFDSAAGLNYTVDVTKPYGERVSVESLADGSAFEYDAIYPVAMTSYRANGGGSLIFEGAGLSKDEIEGRTVAEYPEIRTLIYDFIKEKVLLDEATISNTDVIGQWRFVPEEIAGPLLQKDMELVF